MKKIILACFIMLFTGSAIFAQQTQPAQEKTKTTKKEVVHEKTHAAKSAEHQKQATAAVKESSATTTATPLKKDGTPDKRYKKHSQHVKKDGTADKRFKENKQ
jgi:uncharacterized membrane protein